MATPQRWLGKLPAGLRVFIFIFFIWMPSPLIPLPLLSLRLSLTWGLAFLPGLMQHKAKAAQQNPVGVFKECLHFCENSLEPSLDLPQKSGSDPRGKPRRGWHIFNLCLSSRKSRKEDLQTYKTGQDSTCQPLWLVIYTCRRHYYSLNHVHIKPTVPMKDQHVMVLFLVLFL